MDTGTDHTADYRALSILTKAIIAGILVFSTVALLVHFFQGAFIQDKNLGNTITVILVFLSANVIAGTRFIYTRRVNKLMETNQSSKEKLDIFRAINITHMALCEMPAILSILLFICFGNFLLFLAVGMALVEMIKKFPTQQRIESAVNSGTF
jgi:O-antigen/teichoic acid export membrane protein